MGHLPIERNNLALGRRRCAEVLQIRSAGRARSNVLASLLNNLALTAIFYLLAEVMSHTAGI